MKRELRRGAVIIAVGGLLTKAIGALYRIPLTNFLGAEGMGLYQMVFPVYCALLAVSSTGIPTALSKLITADNRDGYFFRSLLIFGLLGLIGSLIMCVLGGILANLQGNPNARLCYIALSPSVFFVSLISCVRGYFQAKRNMAPTAVSQVVEQIIKAVAGLTFCYIFEENQILSATFASLAVSISEVFALLYLVIRLKLSRYKAVDKGEGLGKRLVLFALPIALMSILIPLGHLADSFLVINLMGRGPEATALFGLYSGSVAAIIGVPVMVAYGASVSAVPVLSAGGGESEIVDSMRFTGFVAFPFWLFFMFFAREIISLLYGGLSLTHIVSASKILALDSVSVVILAFLQTSNAILIAKGRHKFPLLSLGIALLLRIVFCILFVGILRLGIYGAVIASNLSNLIALGLNINLALPKTAKKEVSFDTAKILTTAIICVLGGFIIKNYFVGKLAFVIISLFTVAFYFVFSFLLRNFNLRKVKV